MTATVTPIDAKTKRRGRDSSGKLVRNTDGLPRVERGKDVHRVLEDLDEALSDPKTGDSRLYQRGGELVIARGVMADDAKRLRISFAPEDIILSPIHNSSLVARITEHVDYGYWRSEGAGDDKEWVWNRDLPSAQVLAAFLKKVFWAHVRPIRGISVTPIMHLDGSLVHHGYDAASQYYVASNVELAAIPERPTHDDAKAALTELVEPFAEFPYETEAERYTPVALALTVLLRPVIRGNVPAFVQTAPQKNCGKSLATKSACLLATGRVPASNTWAKVEDEQEKMISAAADAGADVLFFDNVSQGAVIGGAPLDKVLTCDGHTGFRMLGLTQLKHLPWNTTVAFTANRARIGGDTDRRAVVSTLVRPDVPRDTYTHDLPSFVGEQRGRLLAAAFTLVRAWILADKPKAAIRRLDSFEHWGQTVAAMIRWAGGGDVRELVRDVEGTDEDGQELSLLRGLHGWLQKRGVPDVTVSALVKDVFAGQDETLDELRGAIEGIAGFVGKGDGRKLDVRRLGKRFSAMKDLLQGGYRLKHNGSGMGGLIKWTVTRNSGLSGNSGFIQPRGSDSEKLTYCKADQPTEPTEPTQTGLGYPPAWDLEEAGQ